MMETNRIILRPWRESDAEILFKWASNPDVGPRAGWPPHKSVEESLEIIRTVFNDATNTWAIELKETGEASQRKSSVLMPMAVRTKITVCIATRMENSCRTARWKR